MNRDVSMFGSWEKWGNRWEYVVVAQVQAYGQTYCMSKMISEDMLEVIFVPYVWQVVEAEIREAFSSALAAQDFLRGADSLRRAGRWWAFAAQNKNLLDELLVRVEELPDMISV